VSVGENEAFLNTYFEMTLGGHVSYNSRHLAQEDHLKETKTTAQLARAKSTIRHASALRFYHINTDARTWADSLKNWGHVRSGWSLDQD
jgi:hypothetical protein